VELTGKMHLLEDFDAKKNVAKNENNNNKKKSNNAS